MYMKINITTEEMDALVAAGRPVIIDLYAEWCAPCKMMAPIFARVAEAAAGKAEFVKIDIDVRPELADRYGVMSVPTIIGIAGGEIRYNASGVMNEPALRELADNLAE